MDGTLGMAAIFRKHGLPLPPDAPPNLAQAYREVEGWSEQQLEAWLLRTAEIANELRTKE
jgi:hypothetical protein